MFRVACAVLSLAVVAQPASDPALDKAKLRAAIELPAVNVSFGVQFRSHERDPRGNKFDPTDKIAELQKKLNGSPDDVETYFELRAVYLECMKDGDKKAQEMATKAEAVVRPHLQTNDPKHAYLLTAYGTTLEISSDSPWVDCEKLAIRAVNLAPQDWRSWAYLAHVRHQQIPAILCGGDDRALPKERRTQELLGRLHLQRCQPEYVDAAEKALNEALQYHDKAKELAPNDAKRQMQRYGFRLAEVMMRNAIAASRGQKAPYPMQQFERVLLDELELSAKLQPDHLLWHSQVAHQLIMLGWQKDGKPAQTFAPARTEDAAAIRTAFDTIEKIASGSKGEAAIFGYLTLTALSASMQDHGAVEKYAQRILSLDAKNQQAWEQLQHAQVMQGKHTEAVRTGQALVQAVPTSRSWYLAAKSLTTLGQMDGADQACRTGLKQNPTDVHCILGIAAIMMRRSDDATTLRDAKTLLDLARRECRPDSGAALLAEIEYLTAIHQALSGESAIARVKLQRMQTDTPGNQRYAKALAAFTP